LLSIGFPCSEDSGFDLSHITGFSGSPAWK
jgi:hypothetical protein